MNKQQKYNILLCGILLLSAIKLFNLQSVLIVVYIIFSIIYIYKYNKKSIFTLTRINALLFIFFSVYCVTFFIHYGYNYSILRTAIFSCFLFYIGERIVYLDNAEKLVQNNILLIGYGTAIFGTISYFSSYDGKILSTKNVMDRYVIDFWNGLAIPPTNFNTNFLIIFSICSFCVFKMGTWKKVLPLLLTISGVGVAFGTATRTNIFVLVLSFLIYLWYMMYYEHKKFPKYKLKFSFKTFAFLIVVTCTVIMIAVKWGYRLLDLTETLFASLSYRTSNYVTLAQDPRWKSWAHAFIGLFSYPFGNNISMAMEAHNIILETGRRTGIVPFLLLLSFFLKIITNVLKIAKNRKLGSKTRILLLLVTVITAMAMMIEPVFIGRPYIFIYMSLIWGMSNGMCRRIRYS